MKNMSASFLIMIRRAPRSTLVPCTTLYRSADRGVAARRVLTDSGGCYRSRDWVAACAQLGITPKRTRPYRPQTNGKVERVNRKMTSEWAFVEMFASEADRRAA